MDDPSRFRWKLSDYQHRIGFDLRYNECIGLIREMRLCFDTDDSGEVFPYISVLTLDGQCDFLPEEVGYLDIHPGIVIDKAELIESLNWCRDELNWFAEVFGRDNRTYREKVGEYKSLVADIKDIMCANHFFNLHDFLFIQTQNALLEMGG